MNNLGTLTARPEVPKTEFITLNKQKNIFATMIQVYQVNVTVISSDQIMTSIIRINIVLGMVTRRDTIVNSGLKFWY